MNSVPLCSTAPPDCNTSQSGVSDKKKSISPSKHWAFTWNNYNDNLVPEFDTLLDRYCSKFIYQSEIGEESKVPHLQGYICFKEKNRPLSVFKISNSLSWRKCFSPNDMIEYCHKDGTYDGKYRKTKNIFFPKPIKTIDKSILKSWQTDILEIIKNEPNPRTIYWYFDTVGNTGKTSFSKYLAVHHEALILSGKASDMKYGIVKYMEKKVNYPELIVLDIPRSNNDFISYGGIEEIKNGIFFSSKYESSMVVGNSPHIFVFSNDRPDMSKMSKDRWKIREITAN